MGLFSFFKKPDFPESIPEMTVGEQLQQQLDLIPDYYKPQPQFERSVESLAQHEYGLALESLIELAVASGHYFSEHYWEALAQIADKLKLSERARYCIGQLRKTKREIGSQTPLGWTTVKLDATHYQRYIAESIKEGWAAKRRQKDRVEKMRRDGFYQCSHGRGGMIYYIQQGRVLEIEYEIAGGNRVDLIIYFEGATHWALPVKQAISPEEKAAIRAQLSKWLGKVRADI
jgi:hypothetical protein